MPGQIDLNSVIAMMNQAASITEREGDRDLVDTYKGKDTELEKIKTSTSGKKKLEDASAPIPQKMTSNMLPVDPEAQVLQLMNLGAPEQNYAMQVYDLLNTRNS